MTIDETKAALAEAARLLEAGPQRQAEWKAVRRQLGKAVRGVRALARGGRAAKHEPEKRTPKLAGPGPTRLALSAVERARAGVIAAGLGLDQVLPRAVEFLSKRRGWSVEMATAEASRFLLLAERPQA